MLIQILYSILLIAYCFYLYFKLFLYAYWDRLKVDTLKPTFPFGNIGKIFTGKFGLGDCVKEFYENCHGKFAGLFLISSPAIIVKDPDLIKNILIRDFNCFTDRGYYTDEKKEPTSGHLFRLNGERWKSIRNKLTPAFTAGKLKMMFATITDVADQLKTYLEKECDECNVDIEDLTTRYNADIIASAIFGIETNSFVSKSNDFIVMAKDLFVSESYIRIAKAALQVFFPSILKLFNIESVKNAQDKFIFSMVENVIRHREEHKITRSDLMQLLIQLKNKGKIEEEDKVDDLSVFDGKIHNEVRLTLNEVSAQAYTFFFAGYETTSSTMNYLLYECALNHKLQENLQKDIDTVLDKYDGGITYESVSEMEYLDRAISETLRKYPILPFLNRIATKNYKIPDTDVEIKKGMRVLISISGLHHDSKYYPDPQKFDPDRFLNSKMSERHQFTYLPFGEGPRNCIGKRMGKVMVAVGIATLLRNFTVDVCEKSDIPLEFNNLSYFIKTKTPIVLRMTKRFK